MSFTESMLDTRSYLYLQEEFARHHKDITRLQMRIRELEGRQVPVQREDRVLGCSADQFLAEMEIIQRDTGKSLRDAFALWVPHAAACVEEKKAQARADAGGGGAIAAWLGELMAVGMAQQKALCGCRESECQMNSMVYMEGRGFVDRYELDAEAKASAEPKTWADRVRQRQQQRQ